MTIKQLLLIGLFTFSIPTIFAMEKVENESISQEQIRADLDFFLHNFESEEDVCERDSIYYQIMDLVRNDFDAQWRSCYFLKRAVSLGHDYLIKRCVELLPAAIKAQELKAIFDSQEFGPLQKLLLAIVAGDDRIALDILKSEKLDEESLTCMLVAVAKYSQNIELLNRLIALGARCNGILNNDRFDVACNPFLESLLYKNSIMIWALQAEGADTEYAFTMLLQLILDRDYFECLHDIDTMQCLPLTEGELKDLQYFQRRRCPLLSGSVLESLQFLQNVGCSLDKRYEFVHDDGLQQMYPISFASLYSSEDICVAVLESMPNVDNWFEVYCDKVVSASCISLCDRKFFNALESLLKIYFKLLDHSTRLIITKKILGNLRMPLAQRIRVATFCVSNISFNAAQEMLKKSTDVEKRPIQRSLMAEFEGAAYEDIKFIIALLGHKELPDYQANKKRYITNAFARNDKQSILQALQWAAFYLDLEIFEFIISKEKDEELCKDKDIKLKILNAVLYAVADCEEKIKIKNNLMGKLLFVSEVAAGASTVVPDSKCDGHVDLSSLSSKHKVAKQSNNKASSSINPD